MVSSGFSQKHCLKKMRQRMILGHLVPSSAIPVYMPLGYGNEHTNTSIYHIYITNTQRENREMRREKNCIVKSPSSASLGHIIVRWSANQKIGRRETWWFPRNTAFIVVQPGLKALTTGSSEKFTAPLMCVCLINRMRMRVWTLCDYRASVDLFTSISKALYVFTDEDAKVQSGAFVCSHKASEW